ncbi:MAG TPA: SDR family NAD(P)-dependent oxidoreductase, partial [Rhodospirillales bacterium]|nr:SDR family NAD(P)-dependent oxidoreductase [Rhodospirillales bacterium]
QSDAKDPARGLFLVLKALAPGFWKHGEGACLINVTALDGQFGLAGSTDAPVEGAGTLGVAKSAAREWPLLRVKCIDLAPDLELFHWIDQVITEMHRPDAALEVGLTSHGRWHLQLQELPPADSPQLPLDDGAVLLVTGGACGITAEVTKALAAQQRLRLAVVGRSAVPEPEAASTIDILEPGALRQVLIAKYRARTGEVKPAEIEGALKRILKAREIRGNLLALQQAGAELCYHTLDVRDADAFGRLIDDVYARWGRIDGVLHGAGVIHDKLIGDKPADSFDAVYLTKATAALTLARKLRPDTLKFVVFFSSIAGRFGNAGQCDYSAANELLNKLSGRLRIAWPNVRTVSVGWGPWQGGMVSEELIRLYALRNIRPIPMAIGIQHCLDVLARPVMPEPELVITASLSRIVGSIQAGVQEQQRPPAHRRMLQRQQAVA